MNVDRNLSQTITAILTRAIGIDPGSLDAGRLKWIVQGRCRALRLADAAAYVRWLEETPAEIDALIDEVVVPETRFFRDHAVFQHIRQVLPKLAEQFPGPLRILSAPCGTGQEAYSLAASCQQAGLPTARFRIDAFDISLSALATARHASYPEAALRHVLAELQSACATRVERHWKIHEWLRGTIHFERRNLAEAGALRGDGSEPLPRYHLILCRNLFIYLHPAARAALAQSLADALIPGGRLVIGTADRVEELNAVFAPLKPAASFAFVHRERAATRTGMAAAQGEAAAEERRDSPAAAARVRALAEGLRVQRAATPPPQTPASPAGAGPAGTAPALYCQALEHHHRGDARRAERACRQALYLAPDYLPALELLETLWNRQPNRLLSRALNARIMRNRDRSPDVARLQRAGGAGWDESA